MTGKQLNVFIAGEQAGVLSQEASGSLSFRYRREYRGVPLSSAMPLSTQTYRDKTVLPYLWGLLPEDPTTRKRISAEADISPNNPFELLGVIGLDCPGAVQFCQPNALIDRQERLVPVDDEAIAQRLARSHEDGAGWIAENEHWSLGGQQSKFALRYQEGRWYSCSGAAATTHIFKSGVKGLAHQALNEYVCMKTAAACDINTAKVEYYEFSGENSIEPAIVITRYDRLVTENNAVRLHQEDFCQALGCLPDNKYTMYGGPTCTDIIRRLAKTGPEAQSNVARFLQMLFFNYLIAATDAHAKNYSLMLAADGHHRLAPMYDVASIAPYVDQAQWKAKPPKLAMSIGGENRAACLTTSNLEKLETQCELNNLGITSEGCKSLIALYADIIPKKLAEVFDELEETEVAPAAQDLRSHMEAPISQLCTRSKARLLA